MTTTLEQAFLEVAEKEIVTHIHWHHKSPMLISSARLAEMRTLQQLTHKAISFFVDHYFEYEHLMPLAPKARSIIQMCQKYPYRVGTYRPDFLIDQNGDLKICEINARFPLNGYFLSGFSDIISTRMAAEKGIPCANPKLTAAIIASLRQHFGEFDRVLVLKSSDRPGDIRYYTQVFERAGIPCAVIAPGELTHHQVSLSHQALINEFNQMDLESLDAKVIDEIAKANSLNSLRTIFLIHDKCFLSVLSNPSFLSRFLSDAEVEFFLRFVIPTYCRGRNAEIWEHARTHKNAWILKHRLLGKSEGVFAGCLTGEDEWQQLFSTRQINEMILQPFVEQKKFSFQTDTGRVDEYITGTYLCINDCFLGPGIFRSSSFLVTQVGKNMKVPLIITDEAITQENVLWL